MGSGRSRQQIENEATNLAAGFIAIAFVIYVAAALVEQYKAPITFLGTTIGYDYPYAGLSGKVFPISVIIGVVGIILGIAQYSSATQIPNDDDEDEDEAPSLDPDSAQQEIVYCRYCGKEIKSDSVFCQYCGKNLTEQPTQ